MILEDLANGCVHGLTLESVVALADGLDLFQVQCLRLGRGRVHCLYKYIILLIISSIISFRYIGLTVPFAFIINFC